MTLGKEFLSHNDQVRMSEREYINGLGPVLACVKGLTWHNLGVPEDTIKDSLKFHNEAYDTGCRKKKILILKDTMEMIQSYKVVSRMQSGCNESNIAFHTRRLELISQVVKLGYGEGQPAVEAVDLILGRKTIPCNQLRICNSKK